MSLKLGHGLQLVTVGAILSFCKAAPECNAMVDVIFLVDSSSSMAESDFRHHLGWVADLTDKFQLAGDSESESGARFGVMVYSRKVVPLLQLRDVVKPSELREVLKSAVYLGESSHVHTALLDVYHFDRFSSQNGGRVSAKDVVVLISDGKASYPVEAMFSAQVLKNLEVTVMTVGLTPETDIVALRRIASSPEDVFTLQEGEDESGQERVKSELAQRICEVAMDRN